MTVARQEAARAGVVVAVAHQHKARLTVRVVPVLAAEAHGVLLGGGRVQVIGLRGLPGRHPVQDRGVDGGVGMGNKSRPL